MVATARSVIDGPKPAITVTAREYRRLMALAESAARRMPDVAEQLLNEMDRAEIVETLPPSVVGINSTVTYVTDNGEVRRVTLVLPLEADIAQSRISILTPVGVALIGLSVGQSMTWTTRDGQAHRLEVMAVEQPSPA